MLKISDQNSIDAEFEAGWFELQGERRWFAQASPEILAVIHKTIPAYSKIRSDNLIEMEFGNQVGRFSLPGLGEIFGFNVTSGKWDEKDYKNLLLDLVKIASNLPFSASDAASLRYDRSVKDQKDALYHAFVYLEYVMSENAPTWERLDLALGNILRNPHRKMIRETNQVMVWQARDIRPSQMVDIACGKGEFLKTNACDTARQLGNSLPLKVDEQRTVHTFDTPENRFIVSFLDFAGGIVEKTRDVFCGISHLDKTVRNECSHLEKKLGRFANSSIWDEVGPMVHFPAASTVLQRRMGYREVFFHYIRLLLTTRLPLDEDEGIDQLQMKDIALLYELWCFFKVVEAIEGYLGRPQSVDYTNGTEKEISVSRNLKVQWAQGISLLYNASFSRSKKSRHSYSTTLRPDIILEIGKGGDAVRHIFDAKFRLNSFPTLVDDDEEGTEREERLGTYKRADLYKMHTYKDAIRNVESVWVLYPGTESVFFDVTGQKIADFEGEDADHLNGVGAIALKPGAVSRLPSVIESLLEEGY